MWGVGRLEWIQIYVPLKYCTFSCSSKPLTHNYSSVYYNSSKLKCKCNFSLSTCIFNQCLTRTNPSFLGAPNQNPIGSSNWVCVEMCLRIHLGSAFGGRESQSMPLQSILSLKIIIRKRVSLIKHIILWAFVVMSCPHLHYIF